MGRASGSGPAILWLRRDLRLHDHPALAAAAGEGPVLPVFVIDPLLWESRGDRPRAWLARSVQALPFAEHVVVRRGDPATVIAALVDEVDARSVHVSTETTPYGRRRDERVREALDACPWVETGSPYAVTPGRILNKSNEHFKVFTPFARAWQEHGWREPCSMPHVDWQTADSEPDAARLLERAAAADVDLPPAGEEAALQRWRTFADEAVEEYDEDRDRPDHHGTSGLSPYFKVGALHPRTVLAELADDGSAGRHRYLLELAWREFYADLLFNRPDSAWQDYNRLPIPYDDPGAEFDAWCRGQTGFPIVDAGMRQLLATGWMHNRVRMITASFLTKDLHVWWPHGARFFLEHLCDADLASNNHGWQWVAGTGTDAAPYFRVFNPTTQGKKFDPEGDYVRRWVPELAELPGPKAHEPWKHGGARDYPEPIVEHAEERREALRRYDERR